jgi:hypothetical protein
MIGQDGRVLAAGRRAKAVAKAQVQEFGRGLVKICVNAPALLDEERAQIIDTMDMVGVRVREKHAIEPIHIGIEKLLA